MVRDSIERFEQASKDRLAQTLDIRDWDLAHNGGPSEIMFTLYKYILILKRAMLHISPDWIQRELLPETQDSIDIARVDSAFPGLSDYGSFQRSATVCLQNISCLQMIH